MIGPATKDLIKLLLDDPSATVQMFSGMKEVADDDFKPTGGKTVVITVSGGANNVEIRHVKTEDDERAEKKKK